MLLRIGLVLLISFACSHSYAGELDDIQLLLNKKQYSAALTRIDNFIAGNQRHAQARFLKGFILTEMGRSNEAIEIFSTLSTDFPRLPEPYNNLAVLYAQQGQFEKARDTLQLAIQANPSYAIAHENLGDLYARLASEAYKKAAKLDDKNPTVQSKLKLVQHIIQTDQVTREQKITPTPAPSPIALSLPRATEAVKASLDLKSTQKLIETVIKTWASDWSHKNIDAYLAAYSTSFRSFDGKDFIEWSKERRERITESRALNVQLSDIKVEMVSRTWAKVRMRQSVISDKTSTNTNKMLVMQKTGDSWLIEREYTAD